MNKKELMNTLSNQLIAWRNKNKISQFYLGITLDINQAEISFIESKKRLLKIKKLKKISDYIGADWLKLLEEYYSFFNSIKKTRLLKGYSVAKLARLSGVCRNTILKAENNIPIRMEPLKKITISLGLDWEEIKDEVGIFGKVK